VRAVGVATIAGTVVHVLWPSSLLRVAAWPLAAAFAEGFLTPSEATPTVGDRSISES
jgi:hypothetical protein